MAHAKRLKTDQKVTPMLVLVTPLSFLSLVVWISLVNFKQGISLLKLVFSLYFPRISWVRSEQKILGKFGVFLP